MTFKIGDLVDVRAFGGEISARRVVSVQGKIVAVTTPEEYDLATKEQREPISIGFPLSDVSVKNKKASPGTHTHS